MTQEQKDRGDATDLVLAGRVEGGVAGGLPLGAAGCLHVADAGDGATVVMVRSYSYISGSTS